MKKILFIIAVSVLSLVAKAQYPNGVQTIGNDSNVVQAKGAFKSRLINYSFTDTTQANTQRIKQYPGAQIFTTSDSNMWYRTPNANKWVQFFTNTATTTGDTLIWRVGGNALIPMQQQGIYTGLGSKDSTPLFFITNYQRRLVIPPNGVNRSAGTANKCLVIDTVTKFMYYTDCGSGGGTTYTSSNGITLTGSNFKLGGTLVDATTTVDADEKNILINNTDVFQVLSSPPGYDSYARLKMSGAFDGDGILLSQTNEGGDDSAYLKVGLSGVQVGTGTGNYFYVKNLNYTLSTTGKKIMLRDTATGLVQNIDPALLGGSISLAAIGSSPNANGATISGSTLNLEPASASFGGVVTTGTQTLAGNKTLSGITTLGNYMVLPNATIAGGARIQSSSATGYFGLSESNALCQMYWNNNSISVSTGQIMFNVAGVDRFTAKSAESVFNDNSQNYDFRVEGDNDPNLIFVDASTDSVGIGTATPLYKLHVDGTGYFSDVLTIGNGLFPLSDNATDLGSSSKRWTTVHTGNIESPSSLNIKTGGATNYVFGSDGSLSIKKTTSAHSTLEVSGSFATKYTTTATSLTLDDTHSIVNVSASGQTITLPTSTSIAGREYTIINSSNGNITIATTSSQTIGNFTTSTTYTLASDKSLTVVADGTNYKIKMSN